LSLKRVQEGEKKRRIEEGRKENAVKIGKWKEIEIK
jgi:hypothetical protein